MASGWAIATAREIIGDTIAPTRLLVSVATALDAARVEAIGETEAIVRDAVATSGGEWPAESLDFGGALHLALHRLHAAGFAAGIEAAAKVCSHRRGAFRRLSETDPAAKWRAEGAKDCMVAMRQLQPPVKS